MKRFLLIIPALLSACASAPSGSELAAADYGPQPSDYQAIIKDYMSRHLRDPGSAEYEFGTAPAKSWHAFGGAPRQYGWAVCAHINSKNGYGGFVGARKSYFLIQNGSIAQAHHAGEPGGHQERLVYDLCSRI